MQDPVDNETTLPPVVQFCSSTELVHAIVDVSLFPFPSSGLLASRRMLLQGVRTHASFTASPLSFDADFFSFSCLFGR